jgi:pimeloyl-ACP methyl ester carboxylesterase
MKSAAEQYINATSRKTRYDNKCYKYCTSPRGWADGSGWSKEIPSLTAAGHKVIAVQLPLHSLADDVATVKRAVEHIGGPTILVGHSYGGAVITNAGYNNPNVKGLVYFSFAVTGGALTDCLFAMRFSLWLLCDWQFARAFTNRTSCLHECIIFIHHNIKNSYSCQSDEIREDNLYFRTLKE